MQLLSEKIQNICAYANLAQNAYLTDKSEYHKYTQAFAELLRSQISNIDAEKQKTIDEIVRTVFIAYDDMTEGPKKLALYIEHLVTKLQADPEYLQHWSIQSVFDAFVGPQDKTYSDIDPPLELEEYVNKIANEIDESIKLYNEESAANREDNIQDSGLLDDDNDDADKALVSLLTKEDLQDNTNVIPDRVSGFSETSDLTSEDTSFSNENEVTEEFLAEFSKKFNAIIITFQANFVTQPFLDTDKKPLYNTGNHVVEELENYYKIFFAQTMSIKTLAQFDNKMQSIIINWSDLNVTTLSEKSTAYATQAFTKLMISLLKLTEQTRQDERLNPPPNSSLQN